MSRFACAIIAVLVAIPLNAAQLDETPPTVSPRVVGHRGLMLHAPENTLAGFQACLELRIGFELDVRQTQDGALVCVHDNTLDRTTTGRGLVVDAPLADIKQLDAGEWFDASFRGEPIPLLSDVFALLAKSRTPVLIAVDLKADDDRLEADVVRVANEHAVLDRLLFIGRAIDHPAVRRRLREADAETRVGCVANVPAEFAAALADENADWVYLRYLPSSEEVEQVHAAGKQVFLAGPTVAGNLPANWRRAIDAGVDGLLTDYPLDLSALVRSMRNGAKK